MPRYVIEGTVFMVASFRRELSAASDEHARSIVQATEAERYDHTVQEVCLDSCTEIEDPNLEDRVLDPVECLKRLKDMIAPDGSTPDEAMRIRALIDDTLNWA